MRVRMKAKTKLARIARASAKLRAMPPPEAPDSQSATIRRSISARPPRLCCATRTMLGAVAFLVAAIFLRAEDHLSYAFAVPAKSARTERVIAISFSLEVRDDGGYAAKYARREPVGETLVDVQTIAFERLREVTATEARAFFASLVRAGIWKLPKGDDFIEDAPDSQISATISGRELRHCYNAPIKGGARKTLHDTVTGFAKKLGIDQPGDLAKATQLIEGDRTPAREIPFSSLITNPLRYDGKRIAVTGYYHSEFECSALVQEKFAWKTLDDDRRFWIGGASKFARASGARWKSEAWARIEGVFSAAHGGHMGVSPGVISRVTKFEPLDGPPKPDSQPGANEDDPHDLEKLTQEIALQPFPLDGRPIKEVVAALNEQIGGQLTARGWPRDWLKIELDPDSNPKARVGAQFGKPESLRRIIGRLGARISPGEEPPFTGHGGTYTYILPNVIRLGMKTGAYPDDREPISFHEDALGKHAVRAKLVRFAARAGDPETFRVEWSCAANPEELRLSDALALVRRILPDEPGAKSIESLAIRSADAEWDWTILTGSAPETAARPGGVVHHYEKAGAIYPSPSSTFAKQEYLAEIEGKAVMAAPKWNFTGEPPLELAAAIRAARAALEKIPKAEDTLRLKIISLSLYDGDCHTIDFTFSDPVGDGASFLTIPVLLSGKAIGPKLSPH